MAIRVTVPEDLAIFADELGIKIAAFRERNAHKNNLRTSSERNIAMHILGARGEAALYCFFGGKEGSAKWDVSINNNRAWGRTPDIVFRKESYDAKGIEQNHLALVVYPSGVIPEWRYVLIGTQFWPDVVLLGWCTGTDILTTRPKEKVKGRAAYFIEQRDGLLRSCSELQPEQNLKDLPEGYVLQDRDGDYVENVVSTGMETVKLHFAFTPRREKARVFSYEELYSARSAISLDFVIGFSGGRTIRL